MPPSLPREINDHIIGYYRRGLARRARVRNMVSRLSRRVRTYYNRRAAQRQHTRGRLLRTPYGPSRRFRGRG